LRREARARRAGRALRLFFVKNRLPFLSSVYACLSVCLSVCVSSYMHDDTSFVSTSTAPSVRYCRITLEPASFEIFRDSLVFVNLYHGAYIVVR
jgi:hypothetical protein